MAILTRTADLADATARAQKKATSAIRTGRDATADALEKAADRINAGGDRVASVAHTTADALDTTSASLRRIGKRTVWSNIKLIIKEHPGAAVAGALVLAFFTGRLFRRD